MVTRIIMVKCVLVQMYRIQPNVEVKREEKIKNNNIHLLVDKSKA